MGRSIAIYFTEAIREDDFMAFVSETGGCVTDDTDLDLWFSGSGGASVWIYGTRSAFSGHFEAPTEGELAALGASPKVGLVLSLSHEVESGPLALRITLAMLRRWRGLAWAIVGGVFDHSNMDDLANARVALNCFCVFCSLGVQLDGVLEQFDAMLMDAELMPYAQAALRQIPWINVDLHRDVIVAMLAAGHHDDVWLVKTDGHHTTPKSFFEDYVFRNVERTIGGSRYALQVVLRRDPDSMDADRTAVRLAAALVHDGQGLVAGWFDRALGVEDLARILEGEERYFVT